MRRTYVRVCVCVCACMHAHMIHAYVHACVATVHKHANKQHPYVTSVG